MGSESSPTAWAKRIPTLGFANLEFKVETKIHSSLVSVGLSWTSRFNINYYLALVFHLQKDVEADDNNGLLALAQSRLLRRLALPLAAPRSTTTTFALRLISQVI